MSIKLLLPTLFSLFFTPFLLAVYDNGKGLRWEVSRPTCGLFCFKFNFQSRTNHLTSEVHQNMPPQNTQRWHTDYLS